MTTPTLDILAIAAIGVADDAQLRRASLDMTEPTTLVVHFDYEPKSEFPVMAFAHQVSHRCFGSGCDV